MDNFRKFKAPHTTPRGAVDGFVGSGQRNSRSPRQVAVSNQQNSSGRLDNFAGIEGFKPNAQSKLSATAQPATSRGLERRPTHLPESGIALDLPESGASKRKKRSKKKVILRTILALFLLLVLAGGIIFGNAYLKSRKIFGGGGGAPSLEANVDPTKLNGEGDGRVNVLMLGKGGPGHDGADLTDTILIASIDPVQKEASLLSIPRDFWVKSDAGGQSKINAVYANAKYKVLNGKKTSDINERAEKAGLDAIDAKIEEVAGIPIHYHVMVDFAAFEQAINTVGGIDINVAKDGAVYEQLYDTATGKQYVLNVKEGQNHFDGKRALFYSRSRHTSARGDFDRAERQRTVLVALKSKIMSAGTYGNPLKINQLVNEFGTHVRSNFSTGEVLRVYDIMKDIDSSKIGSVGLADPPNNFVTTDFVNGQSIVRPTAGLFDYSAIQNYIRNTLKDGYIKNENASIAVFNGSTIAGLAAKRATDLKSFGYNITTVENAPTKNYSQTVLVDLTGGKKKYTQHYLEQRLKVTAVDKMPDASINPNGAEFVIILGQNESAN